MNAHQVIDVVASHTGHSRGWLDRAMRNIRSAGILPLGGRGIATPDLTAHEVAALLLGLLGSNKHAEAASVAQLWSDCRSVDGEGFAGWLDFRGAVFALLGPGGLRDDFVCLEISMSAPGGAVRLDDRVFEYALPATEAVLLGYDPVTSPTVVRVAPSMLNQIMCELREREDTSGGWTAAKPLIASNAPHNS